MAVSGWNNTKLGGCSCAPRPSLKPMMMLRNNIIKFTCKSTVKRSNADALYCCQRHTHTHTLSTAHTFMILYAMPRQVITTQTAEFQ